MSRLLEVIGALALVGVAVTGAVVALPGMGLPDIRQNPAGSETTGSAGSANIEVTNSQWGEVTEDSIGVESEVTVNNPRTSFQSQINYVVSMNGYQLVSGGTGETTIESGQSTVEVSSQISRENIPNWWISHIENGEQSTMEIQASGEFSKGPFSTNPSTSRTRTVQTEIIESFRNSLTNLEGSYPTDSIEITDTSAEWGEVTGTRTELVFSITVKNNRNFPVPITDFSGESTMGDVQLLNWESNQEDYTIAPGESRQITVNTYISNQYIDDWFASHIENEETTDYVNNVYFSVAGVGGNSPLGECTGTLKTDIFIDNSRGITNRDCQTNPPDSEDVRAGFADLASENAGEEVEENVQDRTEDRQDRRDDTRDRVEDEVDERRDSGSDGEGTPTPEQNEPPNAEATASPSSGEAPLTVTFDGSASSDPDGTIDRYIWQIDGATPGGEGEAIERTFRSQGSYDATLIVVDDDGDRDRTTVTVEVERRSLRKIDQQDHSSSHTESAIPTEGLASLVPLLPIAAVTVLFRR